MSVLPAMGRFCSTHPYVGEKDNKFDEMHNLNLVERCHSKIFAGLQELKILVHFFRATNNMLAYMMEHVTFMHLKQSLVHACTLKCTLPCTYYKDRNILEQKVNLRSINSPSAQKLVWVSRLLFVEKKTADGSLVYPEPNKQTTFYQPCLKAMNIVGPSQCLLV